jgi:hypothetical protein
MDEGLIVTTPEEWSEGFHAMIEHVDPLCYYRDHFAQGFFVPVNPRIALGYIPSGLLDWFITTIDHCSGATDPTFPHTAIQLLFGWKYTLQSIFQQYMRAPHQYVSIEDTFLDMMVLEPSLSIRQLLIRYPVFHRTVQDHGVCDRTVRLLHLLWILRSTAQKCDEIIKQYCIHHQIQTARERLCVRKLFDSNDDEQHE